MIEVLIYSKPGCHLCEIAKRQLEHLRRERRFELLEINILDDPRDQERFGKDIPVIFVAGQKAFQHRLDAGKFLERLDLAERSAPPDAT